MIAELLRKWFGLEPTSCETCEVLRERLAYSERERAELLHRLLDKDKTEPPRIVEEEKPIPIQPAFVPWRVRQQMLEQEDRQRARLTKDRKEEIEKLEQELGVKEDASKKQETVSLHANDGT